MSKLASLISRVVSFVKADYRRFLLEIVLALLVWGVTYLVNRFTENRDLRTCQDERTVLLREIRNAQSVQDSLKYRSQLIEKDHIISQQDETIIKLRERAARDSVYQRSLLQSIQRLNDYVEKGRKYL